MGLSPTAEIRPLSSSDGMRGIKLRMKPQMMITKYFSLTVTDHCPSYKSDLLKEKVTKQMKTNENKKIKGEQIGADRQSKQTKRSKQKGNGKENGDVGGGCREKGKQGEGK